MTESIELPKREGPEPGDQTSSVLEVLIVLANRKRLVLYVPLAIAVMAVVISLLLPVQYTATARVLPPQQTQSATLAQLGSQAQLLAGSVPGIKNPSDLYVGMLKSRTVADGLVDRFQLEKVYEAAYRSTARKRLEGSTTINAGKDGIITIDVDDPDPKRAADLANGYVDELLKLTNVLAVTEASQRRLFFEKQLEQAKENLAKSEVSTRHALEKGGLVMVEGHGRVMAETSARLRAEITVKEIEIGAMRAFASMRNPDLQRLQQQLEVLRGELARVEGTSREVTGKAAPVNLEAVENMRLLRELKYNERTYELLVAQYQAARIDEAKDSSIIQVLDKAIPPDRKSKPKRAVIVILITLAGWILSIALAVLLEALARAQRDPIQASQLARLRAALRLGP
jgi:tyrosine-protein kinase Etk/Wzc